MFVPADKVMPEFTATSIIIGVLLAILFSVAIFEEAVDGSMEMLN